MSHVSDLTSALSLARQTGKWVVLVCSNNDHLMAFRRALSAALRDTDRFSGRTARLDGGGTISVVSQSDEPMLDSPDPISVQFVGRWKNEGQDRMGVWRKAAAEIL